LLPGLVCRFPFFGKSLGGFLGIFGDTEEFVKRLLETETLFQGKTLTSYPEFLDRPDS
jgi:hypothetical protein